MRQYLDAKQQHRDAILFFRMGDFYEMFYEDALVAARALELTLTSRSKDANGGGIPMCGVPFHAVDGYIARLVKKGFRVAICDQVEDPRKAKGLVKREVVRVVSPGHADRRQLSRRARAGVPDGASRPRGPGPRLARQPHDDRRRAARSLDRRVHGRRVSRAPTAPQALADELAVLEAARDRRAGRRSTARRRLPIIAASAAAGDAGRRVGVRRRIRAPRAARSAARRRPRGLRPRAASRRGVRRRRARPLSARPRRSSTSRTCARSAYRQRADALLIDPTTLKHLEIVEGSEGGRAGSLLDELDRTVTSIGSRLLRSWLLAAAGRARADSRSARRGRGAGVPHDRARQVPRDAQGGPGSRAPRRARRARHGRPARSRRPEAVADGHPARPHRPRPTCRRRSSARSSRSSTTSSTSATRSSARSSTIRRRWRATAASPATASTPSSTSCARSADRASRSSPRWKSASARAPASRRSRSATTACSGTTSRSRSRTCTPCRPTITASRRLPAASASSRRRSRSTKRRCSAPTSGFSSASSRSSRRCAARWPPRRRASRRRRARSPRSTCSPRSPRPRPSTTTSSRTCTTATSSSSSTRAIRSSSAAPPPPASRSCPTTSASTARRRSS